MSREFKVARLQAMGAIYAVMIILAACQGKKSDGTAPGFQFMDESNPLPLQVSSSLHVAAIAMGSHHSCALQADSSAWCWGSNEYGQLGSEAPMQRCSGDSFPCSATPLPVAATQSFVLLAASIRHTCGLESDGRAWCWGYGAGGQLGDGRRSDSAVPVAVEGGLEFSSIATALGGGVTCGLTADGSAWCWGPDDRGVLGNGSAQGSILPVPVATSLGFISIAVGQLHACAVSIAGDAYCWGNNWFGQLGVGSAGGDGGLGASRTPVQVQGGVRFDRIAVGTGHSCALTPAGEAYCWGLGHQTGTATGDAYLSLPLAVAGGRRYSALSAGATHSCALTAEAAYCWGSNYSGELGDGTSEPRDAPVRVVSHQRFVTIAAGGTQSCAIARDQTVWCWGGNPWGQIGQPPSDP